VEAAEGGDGGGVDAAEGFADEGDDLVPFGDGVGVVARVGGDKAFACGVVEGALGGLAALFGAEDLVEKALLCAAEGEVVALSGGGGAAAVGGAAAEGGAAWEGGVDFDFVEDVGAGGGGGDVDDVRDVTVVVDGVPRLELRRRRPVVGAAALVTQE